MRRARPMFLRGLSRATLAAGLLLAAAPSAAADFTVTGEARYVDRTFTFGGGFTGPMPELPVRRAKVQVINDANGSVLGVGQTQDDGTFSFTVTGSGTLDVYLRVRSSSDAFGGASNRVRVTNGSGQLYDVVTPVFQGWDMSTDLDVGDLVAQTMTVNGKMGNPWNVLDMMVAGLDYVKAQGASNPSATLRITWPGGGSSFASGNSAWMSDDDGYDDLVILHEFGHVIHNHYSDSDSPGGSHTFGQSDQDPRLSIGEGYASFFAGAVRQHLGVFDPGFYLDANGGGGGGIQLRLRMENGSPFTAQTAGEADEGAVVCALWDVVDTTATNDQSSGTDDDQLDGSVLFTGGIDGDQMLWNVLVGPVNTAANLTVRNFWNGFFTPTNYGNYTQLADVFRDWSMRFILDAAEPNNSLGEVFTMQANGNWSGLRTLYYSADNPPAPGDGDVDFFEFDLCAGSVFTVETRYHQNISDAGTYVDPFITLRRPDGSFVASDNDSGTGRNARISGVVADVSGFWTVEVESIHSYRRTGSYQVRVNVTTPGGGICPCCPLDGDIAAISLSLGGTQAMTLDAGSQHAGLLYWILGSATGTSPGLPTPIGTLPLNFDNYFLYTLSNPNLVPLGNSLAVLDGDGKSSATWSLPPGGDPSLAGITWNHAYFVFNAQVTQAVFLSNALPVITTF